jgi:hypothetical protein
MSDMKDCLVICPYGAPDSDTRKWSDFVLNKLIRPAAVREGYQADRVLDDNRPGDITSQIMTRLHRADLVVADLTESNPNVFYELALRHCTGKPFIHVARSGTKLPFDIAPLNVIDIKAELRGAAFTALIEDADTARDELRRQIRAIDRREVNFDNAAARAFGAGSQGQYCFRLYDWQMSYSTTLAGDWLNCQPEPVKAAIAAYVERQELADDRFEHQIAEYSELDSAQGKQFEGEIYFVVDQTNSRIQMGLAVFRFPFAPPVTIQISGWAYRDGLVRLTFSQPPRQVKIRHASVFRVVDIQAFTFEASFKPDPAGYLEATVDYPGFPIARLAVSRLARKFGIG